MLPNFQPNDYVLTRPVWLRVRVGQNVVVRHTQYGDILKAVSSVFPNGDCLLHSLSAQGVSTEQMGRIERRDILGVVVLRIAFNTKAG